MGFGYFSSNIFKNIPGQSEGYHRYFNKKSFQKSDDFLVFDFFYEGIEFERNPFLHILLLNQN